jgi:hypothetical protein
MACKQSSSSITIIIIARGQAGLVQAQEGQANQDQGRPCAAEAKKTKVIKQQLV